MTIKNIHKELRSLSASVGVDEAWKRHLENNEKLGVYAQSMRELAEKHWTGNASSEDRIQWTVSTCESYFQHDVLERWKQKELRVVKHLRAEGCEVELTADGTMDIEVQLETLDVGSSGNFFKDFKRFKVLPIDIAPSDDSVYFCDFLSVPIEARLRCGGKNVEALPMGHFHIVIFSLLLEYLPSSTQRIKCCEKAFQVLRTKGVLIIITPDSSHEMKNSKQIKNWRWTLAKIGFQRIKVEKLRNLTCMTFRKCLVPEVSRRWADQLQQPYMEFKIEIPQDKAALGDSFDDHHEFDVNLMNELPFE